MRVVRVGIIGAIAVLALLAGTLDAGTAGSAKAAVKRNAYYTDLDAGAVYRVEIKYKATPKLKLRKTFTKVASPWGVAVDPSEKYLLVSDFANRQVVRLSLPKGKVEATIAVGREPTDVAIHPTGAIGYVINSKDDTLSVIDLRSNQVIDTLKLRKGAYRMHLNERGTDLFVTAPASNAIQRINPRSSIGFDNDPDGPIVSTISLLPGCQVSGGYDTARFPSPNSFYFVMYTCGDDAPGVRVERGTATRGGTAASGADSDSLVSSSSNDCDSGAGKSSSTSRSKSCSKSDSSGGSRQPSTKRLLLNPASRIPFGVTVPGSPTDREATAVARLRPFINGSFCASDGMALTYSPKGLDAADPSVDDTYLWVFGQNVERIASGMAFGPQFGGGGDQVYASPLCKTCNAKQVASKTRELTIKGAVNIMDGTMLPVGAGPAC